MNYSKRGTVERLRSTQSTTQKLKSKAAVTLLEILFFSVLLLGAMGVSAGLGVYQGIIDNAPDIRDIDVSPDGFATNIYDREGNLAQTGSCARTPIFPRIWSTPLSPLRTSGSGFIRGLISKGLSGPPSWGCKPANSTRAPAPLPSS